MSGRNMRKEYKRASKFNKKQQSWIIKTKTFKPFNAYIFE